MDDVCKMSGEATAWPCSAPGCPLYGDCLSEYAGNFKPVSSEERHGRWFDRGSLSCRCSECGCKSTLELAQCPACGAIMDLDAGLPDGVVGGDGPAAE